MVFPMETLYNPDLERVAEKHHCPLFTKSCSDYGIEPKELEVDITKVFRSAVSLKAVRVLDAST